MEFVIQVGMVLAALVISLLIGDWKIACVILTICLFLLLLVSFIERKVQQRRISDLIMYLMKVQDNLSLPELTRCGEGQFGILQSEIYKLVVLLKEQSEQATKQNVYLADMLSDISHQIKTPLTSITIMTELLENPELDAEKREEFIGKINRQVDRITWLIRTLLTLSQLEADVLKLKQEKVSVKELLENACQPFELMADVKDISLNVTVHAGIEMICDRHWTTEAISNIVKNCMEHTATGGHVSICAQQNNFSTEIHITDDGEGISKEHLPHIFERFYRGGNTSSDSVGIGLAMSKQILMRQNGIIEVRSVLGEGTTFLIKIYQ